MIVEKIYKSLPVDLAGSRAKNRFRNELLWGIIKFYEVTDDCTIIFDYFCDIELHFTNKFEFYQIKTDKEKTSYTLARLLNLKNNQSIIGKVYILKKIIDEKNSGEEINQVKSSVISNIPLSVTCDGKQKRYTNPGEICFDTFNSENKKIISESLKKELQLEEVDFKSIFFEYTMMDLKNPEDALVAKTLKYATKILNRQPKNLEGLCAMISYEVEKRACYEFESDKYDELVEIKGMNREFLNKLITDFDGISDDLLNKIKGSIENLYKNDFCTKYKVTGALSHILKRMKDDLHLQNKEIEIETYLKSNIDKLKCSELEIVNLLKESKIFNIEDTNEDRIAFIIYVLTKFKEGYYE